MCFRAFDRCRRELAQLVSGSEGVFVGYDALEFSAVIAAVKQVRISAVLRDDLGSRHSVEYRATASASTKADTRPQSGTVIARGTGGTLGPSYLGPPYGASPVPTVQLEVESW